MSPNLSITPPAGKKLATSSLRSIASGRGVHRSMVFTAAYMADTAGI